MMSIQQSADLGLVTTHSWFLVLAEFARRGNSLDSNGGDGSHRVSNGLIGAETGSLKILTLKFFLTKNVAP